MAYGGARGPISRHGPVGARGARDGGGIGERGAATAGGLVLDESAFVSTEHLNKFGKPYPRDAYKRQ